MRLECKQVLLNVMRQVNDEYNFKKHLEAHDKLCRIINLIRN